MKIIRAVLKLLLKKIFANKMATALVCLFLISLVSVALSWRERRPPLWKPDEVKIAFLVGNNETIKQEDVDAAITKTMAQTLFLHAGQFDYDEKKVIRIRAVTGKFPKNLDTHLVYNATSSLLQNFEKVEIEKLAATINETLKQDIENATKDGALIVGLQLDFDMPTRLLMRYGELLKGVHLGLPQNIKLSITGLPTWMDSSSDLSKTLTAVDFWTPQFYGAKIPETLGEKIPVTSAEFVRRETARTRNLNTPFYAGLPAYGYTVLFNSAGKRMEFRGDLAPVRVATDANLEQLECKPFSSSEDLIRSEWRCVYRAVNDGVIDGLNFREEDRLMVVIPTVEALRETARIVREEAGEKLLGICVFRLPSSEDKTNLTLSQINDALTDSPALNETEIRIASVQKQVSITTTNNGTVSSRFGDSAFTITVKIPQGAASGIAKLEGFYSAEPLCGKDGQTDAFQPCSLRRANFLRFKSRSWIPDAKNKAVLVFEKEIPNQTQVTTAIRADDGRVIKEEKSVSLFGGVNQ